MSGQTDELNVRRLRGTDDTEAEFSRGALPLAHFFFKVKVVMFDMKPAKTDLKKEKLLEPKNPQNRNGITCRSPGSNFLREFPSEYLEEREEHVSLHGLCPNTICIVYEVSLCVCVRARVCCPSTCKWKRQNNKYVVTSVRGLSPALMQIHRDVT